MPTASPFLPMQWWPPYREYPRHSHMATSLHPSHHRCRQFRQSQPYLLQERLHQVKHHRSRHRHRHRYLHHYTHQRRTRTTWDPCRIHITPLPCQVSSGETHRAIRYPLPHHGNANHQAISIASKSQRSLSIVSLVVAASRGRRRPQGQARMKRKGNLSC